MNIFVDLIVIGLIFTILAIGTHPLRMKLAKLIEYLRRAI